MDDGLSKMNAFLIFTAAINTIVSVAAVTLAVGFARSGDYLGAVVVLFWALVSLFGAGVAFMAIQSDDPFVYPFKRGF